MELHKEEEKEVNLLIHYISNTMLTTIIFILERTLQGRYTYVIFACFLIDEVMKNQRDEGIWWQNWV